MDRHLYPDDSSARPTCEPPKEFYESDFSPDQEADWERALEEKGRIPFIIYPNLCVRCGKVWPDMFSVPDSEWERYIEPRMRKEMLCRECYDRVKELIDEGRREDEMEGPDGSTGRGKGPCRP
jgi:ferredoxin